MCENVGIDLHYLSLYSPDFNPIKESSCLKAWIRRNRALVEDFVGGGWEEFLHLALSQHNAGGYAPNHFEHALVDCTQAKVCYPKYLNHCFIYSLVLH